MRATSLKLTIPLGIPLAETMSTEMTWKTHSLTHRI